MNDEFDVESLRKQYSRFAGKLLFDLGMGDLKEPIRGQLLASIDQYVSQVLTNTILENLDEATLKAVDKMVDEGDENQDIIAFMAASIPGLPEKLDETFAQSYEELLEDVRRLTQETAKTYTSPAQEETQSPDSSNEESGPSYSNDSADTSSSTSS